MSCRQTKVYTGSRLTHVRERSGQIFTERNTSDTVTLLLRLFSRKIVQSLCCYDYFQEKLCSHCVVMIIFKKNCAVTVVLWLSSRKTVRSLWCYDYFQEKRRREKDLKRTFTRLTHHRFTVGYNRHRRHGDVAWFLYLSRKRGDLLQGVEQFIMRSINFLFLFGIRRNCPRSGRSRSLYLPTKRPIKQTVAIIGAYHFCQLPTKLYPTSCIQS
jgi:hypothetical protein